MSQARAAILTIGTELVSGHTLNSHAQYITRTLNGNGYRVDYHLSCDDSAKQIDDALQFLAARVDLIMVTGGLGPTQDDITRQVIADFMKLPLVANEATKRRLIARFKNYNAKLTDNNFRQIYFPQGARVVVNDVGTADGFVISRGQLTIAALPGPPNEMKHVLTRVVDDVLNSGKVKHEVIYKLFGAGESTIDDAIADIAAAGVGIGIYVNQAIITLRISAYADSLAAAQSRTAPVCQAIAARLPNLIYATEEATLGEVVVAALKRRHLTISTAESCTGGRLGAELTAVPGASAVYLGGAITYSNAEKMRQLGVTAATLEQHGAVSPETATAMANGLLVRTNSAIAVAITGIAGPSGGTAEKPVGLVYIAVSDGERVVVKRHNFRRNRAKNQYYATLYALRAVLDFVEQPRHLDRSGTQCSEVERSRF